jgi:hypothetical protein
MPTEVAPIELWITIAVLLAGTALAGTMAWLERRPRHDFTPRMVPTTLLMFVGALVVLLALVHLINLWGIRTGR